MLRIALFVEGQAEQIFIREMLLRRFAFSIENLCIRCYRLMAEKFERAEFDFGNDDAVNRFLIINAGGDNKVLSAMIHRYKGLLEKGYQMIIGLRDMYCKVYRDMSSVVKDDLNQEMILSASQQIDKTIASQVKIHFAIMEVETWLLALLDKWKGEISDNSIRQIFNPDENLEYIFHPADIVTAITSLSGNPYDKHKPQVNAIMSKIEWEDYLHLYDSNRCPSFNSFIDELAIL